METETSLPEGTSIAFGKRRHDDRRYGSREDQFRYNPGFEGGKQRQECAVLWIEHCEASREERDDKQQVITNYLHRPKKNRLNLIRIGSPAKILVYKPIVNTPDNVSEQTGKWNAWF